MQYNEIEDLLVLKNGVADITYNKGIVGDFVRNVQYAKTSTKSNSLVLQLLNGTILIYPFKNIKKVEIYESKD